MAYPTASQRILFPYWKDGMCVYTIAREYFGKLRKQDAHLEEHDKSEVQKYSTYDTNNRKYVSPWIENNVFWGEDSLDGCRGDSVIITEGITDAYLRAQATWIPGRLTGHDKLPVEGRRTCGDHPAPCVQGGHSQRRGHPARRSATRPGRRPKDGARASRGWHRCAH